MLLQNDLKRLRVEAADLARRYGDNPQYGADVVVALIDEVERLKRELRLIQMPEQN